MPNVWVSNAELIDKWTILEIKRIKLDSEHQKVHIAIEQGLLLAEVEKLKMSFDIDSLERKLFEVNLHIWDLMDSIYRIKSPDLAYASLSMEITLYNQKRAILKRELDELTSSTTFEEKSFFEKEAELLQE